jgi:hypothetical protein
LGFSICYHREFFGLTDIDLWEWGGLASNLLRDGFFKELDAVGRRAVFLCCSGFGGRNNNFRRPSIGQPCVDAHCSAAPAWRYKPQLMPGYDKQLVG